MDVALYIIGNSEQFISPVTLPEGFIYAGWRDIFREVST